MIAEAVAAAAVERVGDGAGRLAAPAARLHQVERARLGAGHDLAFGVTLLAVLDDIGRCVATTAARRLVFFNGHGGNSALLNVANRELRLRHGLMTFLAHPGLPPDQGGDSAPSELGMGVHGGTDETSLMLHLAPDLVDLDGRRRQRARAPRRQPLRPLRRAGVVRLAVRRLRGRGRHRRPDDGHRRNAAPSCSTAQSTRSCARSREIARFDFTP